MMANLTKGRKFSASGVLKILGVSRSGYYSWKKRKPSKQSLRSFRIKKRLLKLYKENKCIYGARKLRMLLLNEGITISERTITKYMQELGIRAIYVKPFTVTTVSQDFTSELKNILNRDFNPSLPNDIWCTDITYVRTDEGFVYLSSVMDLFSRRILAWELSRTLETDAVIRAITKALTVSKGKKPAIIHTDRGVQYTSEAYVNVTKGIQKSYSAKGNPWDNACIESFHALIKREWLNNFHIKNFGHAHRLIFEYIDTFYNTRRIHSHCGYISPVRYEFEYYKALRNATA